MNNTTLKYNGYEGSIEFDTDDNILFGKILFIDDMVSYEGTSIAELKEDFKAAVDDYIATCKEIGKNPQKSYSGTFNVRIGSRTHYILAHEAQLNNVSLNAFVKDILDKYIQGLNTNSFTPKKV